MSKFTLGDSFPVADMDAWKALVEKTLGGADFNKKLVTKTYDNIEIQPLYTSDTKGTGAEEMPGVAPFTRGTSAHPKELSWHVAQSFAQPDPAEANKNILHELKNGVTAISLKLDDDAQSERTITINTLDDMKELLHDVHMHMLPIHLDAGDRALPVASILMALAGEKKEDLAKCDVKLGLDPLGELARRGAINETISTALSLLCDAAIWSADHLPLGKAVMSDTRPYHSAGASPAQEIAIALATGLTYLRAMEEKGMNVSSAANEIYFQVTADADFFGTIAKLRVMRRLWALITDACGIEPSPATIFTETASRMMSERDSGVNMLRTTVACFAAGAAGADAITVEPYTSRHGMPDEQARRIARNTQIILQEESGIAKVLDPAGGSFFIEHLTDDLSQKAWEVFQDIEALGGMFEALSSGHIQKMIGALHEVRKKDIAKRKMPVTGVSEFPDIHEGDVQTADLSTAPTTQQSAPTGPLALPEPMTGAFAAMIDAAKSGASMSELNAAYAGGGENCPALPVISLAEDYEALRAASDAYAEKTGARPKIFLCNLGKVAAFTARATYAKNFFEAGGIEAIQGDGYGTADDALKAYQASGADICILCSSDRVYEDLAKDTAKLISEAGAKALYLAGHPGDKKDIYEAAGITAFIYMGCDVLALLRSAHNVLGVEK